LINFLHGVIGCLQGVCNMFTSNLASEVCTVLLDVPCDSEVALALGAQSSHNPKEVGGTKVVGGLVARSSTTFKKFIINLT
jgi:hypothetical protein